MVPPPLVTTTMRINSSSASLHDHTATSANMAPPTPSPPPLLPVTTKNAAGAPQGGDSINNLLTSIREFAGDKSKLKPVDKEKENKKTDVVKPAQQKESAPQTTLTEHLNAELNKRSKFINGPGDSSSAESGNDEWSDKSK